MKPFQFYIVKQFQKPAVGQSLRNHVQMTFSGEEEDVETVITLETENYEAGLDLLRIKSEVRYETIGFIKTLIGSERKRIQFNEYLQPVDFFAYFHKDRNLMIFPRASSDRFRTRTAVMFSMGTPSKTAAAARRAISSSPWSRSRTSSWEVII